MSAKATQSTTDEPTTETIADTLFITDTGGQFALDGGLGPESGTAHIFEAADGTALCGHPSTAEHDRELVSDASHDHNPVHSHRVCKNCSRAARSRVAAGDLSTGDDLNDMLLTAEAGDEVVIDTGDVTQTVTVDSTGFRHGRININGHTDDYDDSAEYTTDSVSISKRPADDEGSAVIAGDLTADRQRDGVTIHRPLLADGGRATADELTDDRLEAAETITIEWDDFKRALKRDYLTDGTDRSRHNVLRLSPPFEAEMTATYFESEQGTYYPPEMDPKPVHIRPHTIIQEGRDRGFRGLITWPTRHNATDALTDAEVEEAGGVDAVIEQSREIYWEELRHNLPDSFRYHATPDHVYEINIEWVGLDD